MRSTKTATKLVDDMGNNLPNILKTIYNTDRMRM